MKRDFFSNIEPTAHKTFLDILKWNFTSVRARWPKWVDTGPTDVPPAVVEGSRLRISFVNHATVLIQTDGMNILTDPVWSKRVSPLSFSGPKRVHKPGINWMDLPKIDLVLLSHSHYDHLDIATLKKLVARDNPLIFTPVGVDVIIRSHVSRAKCQAMQWNEDFEINKDITISAVPSQHWSSRTLSDRNKTLWCGYVVKAPFGQIYFAGDTGYGSGKVFRDIFTKYGAMDFALIPIGAYEPRWFMKDSHVNPEEAVKIFQDVEAKNAMGIHFGTFQLTDEGRDAPVEFLQQELKKAGISNLKFRALQPGQSWELN